MLVGIKIVRKDRKKQGVGLLIHRTTGRRILGLLAVGLKNVGLLSNPLGT